MKQQADEAAHRLEGEFPTTRAEFESLRGKTCDELKAIGLGNWDDGSLYLFPASWYERIPAGLEIVDINGDVEAFEPGKTDDDRRMGFLPYGVDAVDGEQIPDE